MQKSLFGTILPCLRGRYHKASPTAQKNSRTIQAHILIQRCVTFKPLSNSCIQAAGGYERRNKAALSNSLVLRLLTFSSARKNKLAILFARRRVVKKWIETTTLHKYTDFYLYRSIRNTFITSNHISLISAITPQWGPTCRKFSATPLVLPLAQYA